MCLRKAEICLQEPLKITLARTEDKRLSMNKKEVTPRKVTRWISMASEEQGRHEVRRTTMRCAGLSRDYKPSLGNMTLVAVLFTRCETMLMLRVQAFDKLPLSDSCSNPTLQTSGKLDNKLDIPQHPATRASTRSAMPQPHRLSPTMSPNHRYPSQYVLSQHLQTTLSSSRPINWRFEMHTLHAWQKSLRGRKATSCSLAVSYKSVDACSHRY